MWRLTDLCDCVGGRLVGADTAIAAVGTDSRRDCAGELFVALRGERFDGHDFVPAAITRGAAAVMVDHELPVDRPQCVVTDTRIGLGRAAAAWRARFAGTVVAITGSNGKTTCKEMVAAILAQTGSVRATRGNLNNDIGMPLTLLGAREERFLVLEMGANRAGEIGYLAAIGRPHAALITNAGRAHLEGFGSVEGVARAKGEIASGLPSDGVFVVPAESPYVPLWRVLASGRQVLTFGLNPSADVSADPERIHVTWEADGFRTSFEVRHGAEHWPVALRLAGQHNVLNALAAMALTRAVGAPIEAIQAGLASVRPVAGRLNPRPGVAGCRLIDDSYNANPDSVAAAISVLEGWPGRRHLVLGDLGELGPDAERLHGEIGAAAKAAGITALHAVGCLSAAAAVAFGAGAHHHSDQAGLITALRSVLGADDLVLVKGSRLAGMERVVQALSATEGV
ncbi:UDP-N-acetylmuramoyl-tripeptide--D-alanyl-D-alanine ligase [Thioalkalicoccus limnaeus]|uniref:UDP-N-acetylmuramoyl-tripeptide--D-alanyl-D-alanine ligase n=1 Tax=Thioalkalicoccus limnaeus TaxID=120681 RepID=A0ABV4BEL4_9GAMM